MNRLNRCTETLEAIGADVFDVGCKWQEKPPITLAENADAVTGGLILVASALLLFVLNELAREYFNQDRNM